MADVATLTLRVVTAPAERSIQRLDRSLDRLNTTALGVGQTIGGIGRRLSIALTAPLALGAAAAVKASAEYEKARISFGVFLNDMELGAQKFNEIINLAAVTPLRVGSLQSAAQILLATGGAGADNLLPTLERLGNVARADANLLQRLALNLGQVGAQGKLTGRELRDFGVAGVPLLNELAKNMNKSTAEILELVRAGDVGLKPVLRAFKTMTSEGGKFYKLMEKLAKTLPGRFTTAIDNVVLTLSKFGDLFGDELKAALNIVIDVARIVRSLDPALQKWLVYIAAIAASLGPILLVLGGILTTIGLSTIAWSALGLSIPVIISALAAVLAVVATFATVLKGIGLIFDMTFKEMGSVALWFGARVLGFIINIRTNWKLLTDWLHRNWWKIFVDMFLVAKTFVTNLSKNLAILGDKAGAVFIGIAEAIYNSWNQLLISVLVLIGTWVKGVVRLYTTLAQQIFNLIWAALRAPFSSDISFDAVKKQALGIGKAIAVVSESIVAENARASEDVARIWAGMGDKINARLKKTKPFVGWLDGFKTQIEALPKFVTTIFDKLPKRFVPPGVDDPDVGGTGSGRSSKLAAALEAGSSEAFKLFAAKAEENPVEKKNLKANERTLLEVQKTNRDGIPIKGLKTVGSFK